MRLSITEPVLAQFPGAILGVAVARGIDNAGEDAALGEALRRAEAGVPAKFQDLPVTGHPGIAVWREAYRQFGAKPRDHPSSIENLVRRVLKGQALARINRLVDIYNTVSLEAILPAGAEDLDAIEGDVELAIAGGGEPPVRLLGQPEARPPRAGEVIYRDRVSAICRRWNWKEADRTKLTEGSRNALIVVEGLPPIPKSAVVAAIEEIASRVRVHCGGTVKIMMLDRETASVSIG